MCKKAAPQLLQFFTLNCSAHRWPGAGKLLKTNSEAINGTYALRSFIYIFRRHGQVSHSVTLSPSIQTGHGGLYLRVC